MKAVVSMNPRQTGNPRKPGNQALQMALAGKIDAAEQICRRSGATRAQQAQLVSELAGACVQAQNELHAQDLYRRAIRLCPDDMRANVALADLSLRKGEHENALVHLNVLVQTHPDSMDLSAALAQTFAALGRNREAAEAYRVARNAGELPLDLLWDSARQAMEAELFDDAVESLQLARRRQPTHVQTLNDLGVALLKAGRTEEAIVAFEDVVSLAPDEVAARLNLSSVLRDQKRYSEALTHLFAVRELIPNAPTIEAGLAHTLAMLGRHPEALAACDAGLRMDPASAELHFSRGLALRGLNRHAEAIADFKFAQRRQPSNSPLLLAMGNTELEAGDLRAAETTYARLVELSPRAGCHHRSYAQVHRYGSEDPHLMAMNAMVDQPNLSDLERMELSFALGKANDDLGHYTEAFRRYAIGNALKRETFDYDEEKTSRLIETMLGMKQPKGTSAADSDRPVFIVGMPRSGTTLIEQILGCHPAIAGLGETSHFQSALDACPDGIKQLENGPEGEWLTHLGQSYLALTDFGNGERIVDKMPSNFYFAGLIHLALPNAKIIHLSRNPLDTCLSCFFQLFEEPQAYSYELGELGRFYRGYRGLMSHWSQTIPESSLLQVGYEAVVDDLEGQAKRLIEFCGLPWDHRCLDFHASKSTVLTASAAQVRRPIYRNSIGRSEPYLEFLGPLIHALGEPK